jgi:hypothetical protein
MARSVRQNPSWARRREFDRRAGAERRGTHREMNRGSTTWGYGEGGAEGRAAERHGQVTRPASWSTGEQ